MPLVDWTARLTELAAEADVPGAVLGIWVDGEQTIAPYGVLSRATGVEVTADSVFQVGSITKPWTATMIMQLVDEGRLTLDEVVVKLLPDVQIDGEITVRHLLTHTSGIDGDIFTDTGRGDDCLERYVELLGSAAQLFPPGAAYSYCNAGFVLLGRIIEVLDSRTWDESLRVRLIEPLSLAATVTLPEEAILHRAAVGHTQPGLPVTTWQLPRSIGPAGLITLTAADLLAFARFHLDVDESLAAMRVPQVSVPGTASGPMEVGLGWRLYDWSGRRVFGHDGATISQLAFLRIDPEARLAVCLLTNSANAPALFESVVSEVFEHHVGVRVPPAPQPVEGVTPDDRHLGRYERAGIAIDVARQGEKMTLTYRATGDRVAFAEDPVHEYELRPAGTDGDQFVVRDEPGQPWVPATFATLADGTPYLFTSGLVTPRIS
jgi:CubicO group peptidase (beta-lactamase class C family)